MRASTVRNLPAWVFLGALNLLWLVPVYLILVNASRPSSGFDPSQMLQWPSEFSLFTNIATAIRVTGLLGNIGATLLYSVVSPLLGILIGALAGYGIITLRLRHGFWWFMVIFGASIVPLQMLIVPIFTGYARLGLYNTQLGMIIIYTVVTVPFAAFVMRNFFLGLSDSLFESANLDGASKLRIFWSVYLPMATPALVAIFILQFTATWNDLLLGITLSWSPEVRPVMPALATLQTSTGGGSLPLQLAASLFVSIPTVAIFFASQRFFRRGLVLGQVEQ